MKQTLLFLAIVLVNVCYSQILPPKKAYPLNVKQIHSGHSLTDPLFHPWPGQYRYLVHDILGGTWDNLGKATIPGSPMFWRWNNEQNLQPVSARYNIADWELLVITEGIPIPKHWQTGLITDANKYLSLYVNNAWNNGNNGNGAATLLWTTWTNIDDSDGPWRKTLDEYELLWEEMMDYANANRPANATPVYIIPGHRMMARLYDDIQANLVPGISNINAFFSDNIHVNDLGAYAVAMIHYACIYNSSPVGLPISLFSSNTNHSIPSPALANYLQTMIWEVVSNYPRTGIYTIPTSTQENDENMRFKIYPNPAHDYLYIQQYKTTPNDKLSYTIYNFAGEKVMDGTGDTVNIQKLRNACYVLKINNQYIRFIKN